MKKESEISSGIFVKFAIQYFQMKKLFFSISTLCLATLSQAQNAPIDQQWQHADFNANGIVGTSASKALKDFSPATGTFAPIIVAIIDSGTETEHPDLTTRLWTNKGEIAGNGVDDDKNGYIDDIHGWSFIGGKNGDVEKDNMEFVRVYKMYHDMFPDGKCIKGKEKEFKYYQKLEADFQTRKTNAQNDIKEYEAFEAMYGRAKNYFKTAIGDNYTKEEVMGFQGDNDSLPIFKQLIIVGIENNFDAVLPQWGEQVKSAMDFGYNLDFDPRAVVGDNYSDVNEMNYGNNHIDGPAADHGTHVAGILGAARDGKGMDGICPNAELMIIRCVPDGDERDKDVANAIIYAVNNGARVINMSFGKAYSPFKSRVDEAVKFAESKGVLLVHAAGNDNKNVDIKDNFPTAKYLSGGECSTWLEIGASDRSPEELKASFSNFGRHTVDVFAPGVDIYSTVPGKKYEAMSGTSMASPVTAGVAAAILSYYPQMTALEVKNLILESAVDYSRQELPLDESRMRSWKEKVFYGKTARTYSLGWVAVDDDGKKFDNLFSAGDNWSKSATPVQFKVSQELNADWKASVALTFMKLNARMQNGVATDKVSKLNAYDLNTEYSLVKGNHISFHTIQGLGYTDRSDSKDFNSLTLNTGLGLDFHINRAWSVSAQSQAKWGLSNLDGGASYLQHSLSLNYTLDGWNTFGRLSRSGKVVNLYNALQMAEKRSGN